MTYFKITFRNAGFFLSFLLLLASCKTFKSWDEARENFSKGAMVEMAVRNTSAEDPGNSAFANLGDLFPHSGFSNGNLGRDPKVFYLQSYKDIQAALEKSSKLRQTQERGNALAMKALAEWKIDSLNRARRTANLALEELLREPERDPRDEALMEALPGLIAIDEAFESVQAMIKPLKAKADQGANIPAEEGKSLIADARTHYTQTIKGADGSLFSALSTLENAKQRGLQNKEILRYLVLSQLAGLNTWQEELNAVDNSAKLLGVKQNDPNLADWIRKEWNNYRETREKHLDQLAELLPEGEENPGYIFWKKIL